MTPKEAFKIGFLQKCADDGLSREETMTRIRHAKVLIKTGAGWPGEQLLSTAWNTAWPLFMLAPPAAGVAGGYALANLQDDSYDKKEARKREIISEYQRAVERLQRLRAKQQEAPGTF
jgi:enoyl-CoA hydratase/carnithine racemase